MIIENPGKIYNNAFRERWALGAFNTSNLEITQAIAWGLKETNSPGIIQTSEGAIDYAGLETIHDIVESVAKESGAEIILHLDHGKSFEKVERCVEAGYKSVMIDGSALSFEENVRLTKQVVDFAHARGVWVEGEMGAMQGKEGMRTEEVKIDEAKLTKPAEALEFVRLTGVDSLAVAIGTIHGAFRGEEKIRFDLLKDIREVVNIPLVLHGASGLPDAEIAKAAKDGIVKVNIDTELREAFHDTFAENRNNNPISGSVDPRKMLAPAREAVKQAVMKKVIALGSSGKAV